MPDTVSTPAGLTRRDFMHVSLAGSVLLGAASATALLTGCNRRPLVAEGFRVLRSQDLPMLRRLFAATLGDALPGDDNGRGQAIEQAVRSFDRLLHDTSPAVTALFTQLLDLLNLGIARGPVFGLWKPWEEASFADASGVLDRLAASPVGFLRGAYNGLNTMLTLAWYLEPANHAAAGYPGPPRKIVA